MLEREKNVHNKREELERKKTRQKQRFIVILKCNALHKWDIHKVRQHFYYYLWNLTSTLFSKLFCLFVYSDSNRRPNPLNWTLASCSENNPFIERIELILTRCRLGVFGACFRTAIIEWLVVGSFTRTQDHRTQKENTSMVGALAQYTSLSSYPPSPFH